MKEKNKGFEIENITLTALNVDILTFDSIDDPIIDRVVIRRCLDKKGKLIFIPYDEGKDGCKTKS